MRLGISLVLLGVLAAGQAHADNSEDAKRYYEKATAEFGLGNYLQAAQYYEAAFRLRTDSALLYNAAQAYRTAGSTKRALELYQNLVRLFPDSPSFKDAKRHIAELERRQAQEGASASASAPSASSPVVPAQSPRETSAPAVSTPPAVLVPSRQAPPTPAPSAATSAPTPSPVSQPSPGSTAPVLSLVPSSAQQPDAALVQSPAQPAPPPPPLLSRPWFWVVTGSLAVAGAVTLLVVLNPKYPDASFGQAAGN